MIFKAFFLALGKLGDARFRRVVLRSIGLTLLALTLVGVMIVAGLGWVLPDQITLPLLGQVSWVDNALSWSGGLLILALSPFLMMPVAVAVLGLFLESVADAVEDRHYPTLPQVSPAPLMDTVKDTLSFFVVMVLANIAGLVIAPFTGIFAPLVFWAINGFLLGREYFSVVALRRIPNAEAVKLRRRLAPQLWLAGTLMAIPLSLPILGLIIPVFGVATFTHIFHLSRR
jgi:CysZ protein